ncbi:hypothetical protein ABPG77_006205 [Micractinium sp. CCAP 211/92]
MSCVAVSATPAGAVAQLQPCRTVVRPFCAAQKSRATSTSQLQAARRQAAGPRRLARLACQAAGFGSSTSKDEAAKLPKSRDEAVSQAAAAIAAQLSGGGKGSKGFAGEGSRKLCVDVPVVESGGAAMVQLAQEIVAALPKPLRQQFTIISCTYDGSSGSGSSSGGVKVVSLKSVVERGEDLDGCLLFAGPSSSQLDSVMRLLAYWRGAGAVALNADWSAETAPVEQVAFIKSFEAVYCFLPLMVKVLFIGKEGAVFKWCTSGSPNSAPWRIFGKEGNRLEQIGQMKHRPSNADLETVFYNAFGVNNPLNRGIQSLRNMVGGNGGGKGGKQ